MNITSLFPSVLLEIEVHYGYNFFLAGFPKNLYQPLEIGKLRSFRSIVQGSQRFEKPDIMENIATYMKIWKNQLGNFLEKCEKLGNFLKKCKESENFHTDLESEKRRDLSICMCLRFLSLNVKFRTRKESEPLNTVWVKILISTYCT